VKTTGFVKCYEEPVARIPVNVQEFQQFLRTVQASNIGPHGNFAKIFFQVPYLWMNYVPKNEDNRIWNLKRSSTTFIILIFL
jgi:hypothetical protein